MILHSEFSISAFPFFIGAAINPKGFIVILFRHGLAPLLVSPQAVQPDIPDILYA